MNKTILATALAMALPAMSFGMLRATEGGGGSTTILDLDNMFDMSMDEVADVPDFVIPPAGSYMLKVHDCKMEKFTPKAKAGEAKPGENSAARIKLFYSVEDTLETDGLPVKDGSIFSEHFNYSKDGLEYFKKAARNILNVDGFPGASLKDVIDGLKGAEFKAALTIRKSANPAGGEYENVSVRPVHEATAA